MFDRKATVLAELIRGYFGASPRRILVVGCGAGREAAQLAISLSAEVIGIDIEPHFDDDAAAVAKLEWGDATALDFPDGAFDFVYSYHALEHIPDFRRALAEMRRVLARGGGYCIGTPNRQRLIGYIGSDNTPLSKKLAYNLNDWKARLRGRFRNEHGAHAGFTHVELQDELSTAIGPAVSITMPYYLTLYAHRKQYVHLLHQLHVSNLLFPAIYFVGRRHSGVAEAVSAPREVAACGRSASSNNA